MLKDQLENIFTNIYIKNIWFTEQSDSKSGMGSSEDFTINIRHKLVEIIAKYNITNIIDTSCGDLYWMRKILPILNCKYTGIDIVKHVIDQNINLCNELNIKNTEFISCDFLEYLRTLPDNSVDLILCRHTCEHLPTEHVISFINEAKRVSRYLLLTTYNDNNRLNTDIQMTEAPYRPINLSLSPYSELLNMHLLDSIYDGPLSHVRSEMYINFYKFR